MEQAKRKKEIDEINIRIWHLKNADGKKSLQLAEENIERAHRENYSKGEAEALTYYTILAYWFSLPVNYLEQLYKAADLLNGVEEPVIHSRLNNILAMLYDHYGDYKKAIGFCDKAIKYAGKEDAKAELSDALTTYGQIHLRFNDFDVAINSFSRGLKIRAEQSDQLGIGSSYNLIARTFTLQKRYEEAKKYYYKALEIREKAEDSIGIPWTYLGLATVSLGNGEYQEAVELYQKGIELNKVTNNKRYELVCRMGIGEAYLNRNYPERAKKEFDYAMEKAEVLRMKPLQVEINRLLADCAEVSGEHKLALMYLKKHIKLKEEVLSYETNSLLRNQQVAFSIEESRREAEIYQLKNVELRNAYEDIEEKNKQIIDSILYAQRIQTALLPPQSRFKQLLPDSFVLFIPKDIVSGDFYWIAEKNGKIYFTDADCSGHGVPGAFVSIIGKIGLDKALEENKDSSPAEILANLNEIVTETFHQSEESVKDGMDIGLCAFNPQSKILEFAGARNSLYLIRDNELFTYKGNRQSIESLKFKPIFTNHLIELNAGDRVYISTDGYFDQFGGPGNKKLLQKRFKELLLQSKGLSMQEQEQFLRNEFMKWKGDYEQVDDVSLIGVRF